MVITTPEFLRSYIEISEGSIPRPILQMRKLKLRELFIIKFLLCQN